MPGGLVGLGARTSARLSLANRLRPVFNTTVTNMPGPRHPLYMAGARLVAMYGAGMIVDGMGLIHPVMSYCGDITISFTSCREMLPDPAHYAACIRDSFEQLAAARAGPPAAGRYEAAPIADGESCRRGASVDRRVRAWRGTRRGVRSGRGCTPAPRGCRRSRRCGRRAGAGVGRTIGSSRLKINRTCVAGSRSAEIVGGGAITGRHRAVRVEQLQRAGPGGGYRRPGHRARRVRLATGHHGHHGRGGGSEEHEV